MRGASLGSPATRQIGKSRAGGLCALVAALSVNLLVAPHSMADHDVPLSECINPDNGDPVLTGLEVSPELIDVTGAGAEVTVRAVVADTGGPGTASGVGEVLGLLTKRPRGNRKLVRFHEVGGGVWTATVAFARGARPGSWRLGFTVYDRAGNKEWYPSSRLRDLGMVDGVTVKSVYDTEPPEVVDLELSKSVVDTRSRPTSIRFRAKLRDNLGVKSAYLYFNTRTFDGPGFLDLALVRGTRRLGTWAATLRLGRWAGTGPVKFELHVRPQAGTRSLGWTSDDLAQRGLPSRFELRSGTDDAAPALSELSISPRQVDIREVDATVEIRVRAQDAGSGVRSVFAGGVRLRRVSGTAQDGVWVGVFTVRHCLGIAWADASVGVVDDVGNDSRLRLDVAGFEVTARGDLRPPHAKREQAAVLAGVVAVTFDEDVTGITSEDMIVFTYDPRTDTFNHMPVPGAWTCQDAAGLLTDCRTGHVRRALFAPTTALDRRLEHWVKVNPEHHYGVRDLFGNAARRETS